MIASLKLTKSVIKAYTCPFFIQNFFKFFIVTVVSVKLRPNEVPKMQSHIFMSANFLVIPVIEHYI